jgi:pilus assembly protein CpaC
LSGQRLVRRLTTLALSTGLAAAALLAPLPLRAQGDLTRVSLSAGRSLPLQAPVAISRVTVANPEIADVVVAGEREVVINGKQSGETDVLLFGPGFRRQYRVTVQTPSDRQQVVLNVRIAEIRRDLLQQLGVSGVYGRGTRTRAGTGIFNTDQPFLGGATGGGTGGGTTGGTTGGSVTLPNETRFLTLLTDFGTRDLLALIEAEEQRGRARLLAQPALMTANRDSASFLVGGEVPIPIAQPGQGGQVFVTIVFREFGVKLNFRPEVLSDDLINLRVRPEVSSLDFVNATTLAGFRVPALRTRRVQTTVDVPRDRSLVLAGLFNEERERVRNGIPFLMDIPLLGNLFSSTRWQQNETELVVIVTPSIVTNPLRPRPQDVYPVAPDTALPARETLQTKVLPRSGAGGAPQPGSGRP